MSAAQEQLRLGAEPRVDLMPPEVRDKQRGRGIRRLLVIALVGSLVIVGAGYAAATMRATAATAELQQAQAHTSELLAQQLQYAEVTRLEALRERVLDDRALVTAREVLWKETLDPLLRLLPEGASIVAVNVRAPALAEPDLQPAGALREPRVAEVTLVVLTPGIPPVTSWLRALENTPAFADAIPSVVSLDDGGYTTTLTLNVDDEALAQRFGDANVAPADSGDEEADE